MGYWNAIAKDEDNDEPTTKVDWYAINQFIIAIVIAILSFLAGHFSVEWNGEAAIVNECKNVYAPNYANGVLDRTLQHINQFIYNCTPTNVEAFVLINSETSQEDGVMLRCNESLLPLRYSR